jgi:hypothetical protein
MVIKPQTATFYKGYVGEDVISGYLDFIILQILGMYVQNSVHQAQFQKQRRTN